MYADSAEQHADVGNASRSPQPAPPFSRFLSIASLWTTTASQFARSSSSSRLCYDDELTATNTGNMSGATSQPIQPYLPLDRVWKLGALRPAHRIAVPANVHCARSRRADAHG
eukprot:2076128-Pleurochrysis_carterae.AAC.2